jgi:hypothetical protein
LLLSRKDTRPRKHRRPAVPRVPTGKFDMLYSIPGTAGCQADFCIFTRYSFASPRLPVFLNLQVSYFPKIEGEWNAPACEKARAFASDLNGISCEGNIRPIWLQYVHARLIGIQLRLGERLSAQKCKIAVRI